MQIDNNMAVIRNHHAICLDRKKNCSITCCHGFILYGRKRKEIKTTIKQMSKPINALSTFVLFRFVLFLKKLLR